MPSGETFRVHRSTAYTCSIETFISSLERFHLGKISGTLQSSCNYWPRDTKHNTTVLVLLMISLSDRTIPGTVSLSITTWCADCHFEWFKPELSRKHVVTCSASHSRGTTWVRLAGSIIAGTDRRIQRQYLPALSALNGP